LLIPAIQRLTLSSKFNGMKKIILGYLLIVLTTCAQCQTHLKSLSFGRLQMLTNVSKQALIDELLFFDGVDDKSDVVRLDFVIPNGIPLIISSKKVIQSDSLGAHFVILSKESLDPLMSKIQRCNSKVNSRLVDYILLRVTYRYNGQVFQYYQTMEEIVTAYLRTIFETQLRKESNGSALAAFYEFVRPALLDDFKKPLMD
jgi:hypothetical protein